MFDKSKTYTIAEVSKITGYDKHVLRYYEKEFEIEVPRNKANHRHYTYKEIETYKRIKDLQENGYTNKQIKLIINSPEVLIQQSQSESAMTTSSSAPTKNQITELSSYIKNEIKEILILNDEKNIKAINDLNNKIEELTCEIRSKERDILICENAKLKMKIKEKSYEVAELREKLKREQNSRKGLFKKIFS
ncbi:helix-turn-helix domain-containing protein [Abyssisolibacter fermentans]|uniref:helix-turn-helix domain-containing protein n=1 Tax=Abyssisolibacter fermentans TaxID=1766203 RepID=UPI00082B79DB|nr:helix-turn-helix domain-containing protein [Abyssisolibacter fermentans]